MVDFLGYIATATMMVLGVNALITFMDMPRSAKLILAGVAGLWIGICAGAATAGWLAIARPFAVIGIFVATPLIAAAVATAWPAAQRAVASVPMALMVGLNAGRLFAVLFFLLWAQGRLAGPFPFFAGLGDIITGLFALGLVGLAKDEGARHSAALFAWNLFGIADLVLAIALGVTSGEGSPIQIFHSAPGSEAMQYLPWSFVPTVLVPWYLIMHGIIWARLRRRRQPAMATA
jgi:hypothetical protein